MDKQIQAQPVVQVRGLVKRFARRSPLSFLSSKSGGQLTAVAGVDLDIHKGEVVGLVGESGSGKTTLGKCLLRLSDINEGQVLIEGQDLFALDKKSLRASRARYQMIFQNPHSSLNPGMRVEDILGETLSIHLGLTGDEASKRIDEILGVVSLAGKRRSLPAQLSGGEKRRVGLAKVLLLSPRVIVADEPTAGLDASLKAGILRLMLETRSPDMAYLVISHDLHLIRTVADRVLVMFRGHIVEEVKKGEFELGLIHHPYTELLLSAFYLGGGRQVPVPPPPPTPVENLSLPLGEGCCYYPYCTRAQTVGSKSQKCQQVAPPLAGKTTQGRVACHFV